MAYARTQERFEVPDGNLKKWIKAFLFLAVKLDTRASLTQVKYILEWMTTDLVHYFNNDELFWFYSQFQRISNFWQSVFQYQKAKDWADLTLDYLKAWKASIPIVDTSSLMAVEQLSKEFDDERYQEILAQLS